MSFDLPMMAHHQATRSGLTLYRAFSIDASGHVDSAAKVIAAHDDREAIRRATSAVREQPLELWEAARLVTRITPAGAMPSSSCASRSDGE